MASGTEQAYGSRLWEKAKGIVRLDIGQDWKGLASACGLNTTTIDEISHSCNILSEQIEGMFRKVSMQQLYTTAFSLMQCLRLASNNCQMETRKYKDLAEYVFNVIVEDVCCDLFYDKWETVAKAARFNDDLIHNLKSQNLKDFKKQGLCFLHKWISRSSWDILKELPRALKDVPDLNADKVVQDVFGMPSLEYFVQAQQASQPVPDQPLAVGDAVTIRHAGIACKGTLKWTGYLPELGQELKMAGIELAHTYEVLKDLTCNGTLEDQHYFHCREGAGMFVDCTDVQPSQPTADQDSSERDCKVLILNLSLCDDPPSLNQLPAPVSTRSLSLPSSAPLSRRGMVRSTSSPGPSPQTTPQPYKRRYPSQPPSIYERPAGPSGMQENSVEQCREYKFVSDVVSILADPHKKEIEDATGTTIIVNERRPSSHAESISSNSLQSRILTIYGTDDHIENAVEIIKGKLKIKVTEFVNS